MSRRWKRKTLRLKDGHGWKAKPGHAILALDRGAIRFDYPSSWNVSAEEGQVNIRDAPEPNDNCVLAVSRLYIPQEVADRLPLQELILGSIGDDDRDVLERKDVVQVPRDDGIELAYTEMRHMDRQEKREAISRLAIGRGFGVYCLITFDVWVDDLAAYDPVWTEALRSLTLGMSVKDPTVGPIIN